jgi:enamine deaminase RidA (YjgF/YER057c/UK114 family)
VTDAKWAGRLPPKCLNQWKACLDRKELVGHDSQVRQTPDDRVRDLGLSLPSAGAPLALYVPLVISRDLIFVSGHGPLGPDRRPVFTGRIGRDLSDSDAVEAARLTTLNILATLRHGLGSLNLISRLAELRCFLVAEPSSTAHLSVPRAVAELFTSVFGPDTASCQTTIGIGACVLDLPITVDLIAVVGDHESTAE